MTSYLSFEGINRFSLKKYELTCVTLVCLNEKWKIYSTFCNMAAILDFFRMAIKWEILIRFENWNHWCICFFIMIDLNTNMVSLSQKTFFSYFWSTRQPFSNFRGLGGPSKIILKIWKNSCVLIWSIRTPKHIGRLLFEKKWNCDPP